MFSYNAINRVITMPLVMSTFGPSQSSSITPSAGVASNLLSAEGISVESAPYVTVGGQVRRADYGKTIAGSLRLNRLMGIVGPAQQQNILQTVINANIKQYLSEGYTQQDTNTLKRSLGGGMAQFISINRATGEFNTSIGTDPSYIAQQQQAQQQAQASAQRTFQANTIGPVASLQSQAVQARNRGQTALATQLETQAKKLEQQQLQKSVDVGNIGVYMTSSGLKSMAPSIAEPQIFQQKVLPSILDTVKKGGSATLSPENFLKATSGVSSGDLLKAMRPSTKTVTSTASPSRSTKLVSDPFSRSRRIRFGNNNVLDKFLR